MHDYMYNYTSTLLNDYSIYRMFDCDTTKTHISMRCIYSIVH